MLSRGLFSENFRLAQWFKVFYEANVTQQHHTPIDTWKRSSPTGAAAAAAAVTNTKRTSPAQPRRPNSVAGAVRMGDRRSSSSFPSSASMTSSSGRCSSPWIERNTSLCASASSLHRGSSSASNVDCKQLKRSGVTQSGK